MTDTAVIPPPVMWAQRKEVVFLTINLEDVKDPDIKIEKDSVYFKGVGGVEKRAYEVKILLYKEIDPKRSRSFNRERCIEFILTKANDNDSYWPTLTSDKKKHHWLKCDFNKWQDEDESGDELGGGGGMGGGGGDYFEDMMRQIGGINSDAQANPEDMDDLDSDDESIPSLE
ncbi:co-chaperone protein daf-41 [Onthophagus taurus]|uniref:co-chaperone protein daf-41 n=1 Tax=Onthophagus taurus TaxID=166361 RepID=UPI0039BDE86E